MDEKLHALLIKRLNREKAARKAAEQLLEEKSRELFDAQKLLQQHAEQLKLRIDQSSAVIALQSHLESVVLRTSQALLHSDLTPTIFTNFVNGFIYKETIPRCQLELFHFDERVINGQFSAGGRMPPAQEILEGTRLGQRWYHDKHYYAYILYSDKHKIGTFCCEINAKGLVLSTIKKQVQILTDMITAAIHRQLTLDNAIRDRERAEASERSTHDFLAMINHELRSPLNGLLGGAELLDSTPLNSKQKRLLETINYSGELLRSVINDLLDYSKINANMLQLVNAPFSVNKLRDKLQGIFYFRASENRLDLSIHCTENIPETIIGDEDRIKQIFVNLIGNAIKFTTSGSVKVSIDWQDSYLIFTVTDTGKGIADEDMHRLFKPFSQVDNSSNREHEGTGLGLAICEKLAKQMQGGIDAKSTLGVGSEFTVKLKLAVGVIKHNEKQPVDYNPTHFDHLRVLVVEDMKTNQMIFNLMMSKLGITPEIANNGQEALSACAEQYFDVIFMDNRMPIMDGITATKILRSQGFQFPIIALTASTTRTEREACFEAGVNDILSKPYQFDELKKTLVRWVIAS
ncbi:ATP-binding protein [Thaumasiovibrio sp. DFM-14]|uniref:ATP-binding protein n=1 Tax=Thaumasiovibrio sp. DFM-14 TaxID=3384792 RepID=UPI0039A122A3